MYFITFIIGAVFSVSEQRYICPRAKAIVSIVCVTGTVKGNFDQTQYIQYDW